MAEGELKPIPYPNPTVRALSTTTSFIFAATGILLILISLLVDCLQQLNLLLGIFLLAMAVFVFWQASRAREADEEYRRRLKVYEEDVRQRLTGR